MQRRDFIISLSSAIATIATACRKPVHKIIPMVMPDEISQTGEAVYYNTIYPHYGIPYGISVKTREGRPIKIEANPLSPINPNGTNATIQAAIYSLYAPPRFRKAIVNNSEIELNTALNHIEDKISQHKDNANILILSEHSNSLILKKLKNVLSNRMQSVRFFEFPSTAEADIPLSFFDTISSGKKKKYIISLGADLLGSSKYSILFQHHLFAQDANNNIEILTAEPMLSQTGIGSSIRETRNPNELEMLAALILQKISKNKSISTPPFPIIPREYSYLNNSQIIKLIEQEPDAEFFLFCADYLSDISQAIASKINGFANILQTARYLNERKRLENSISKNSLLIFLEYNPYYSDMAVARIADSLPKQNRIALSQYYDETAANSGIHIPASNFLENWDLLKYHADNKLFIQQPVVQKLNKHSISSLDFLLRLFTNRNAEFSDEYLYLRKVVNLDRITWRKALQTGHFPPTNQDIFGDTVQDTSLAYTQLHHFDLQSNNNAISLIVIPSVYQYYGLEPDNPYLQELPDPLSKLSWNNAAMLGKRIADKFNLAQGSIISISIAGKTIELPVYICKSCSDDVILVEAGFGARTNNVHSEIGTNIMQILPDKFNLLLSDISIRNTGKQADLSIHNPTKYIDLAKSIVNINSDELLKLKNKKHKSRKPYPTFRKEFEYLSTKWEMQIELSKCTGCSACVVACQIENNIPIVGDNAIRKNKSMYWLNINSYVYNYQDDIVGEFEPLMCQQCENAPCETVCPVAATTHSPEGINEMTYNRCVGSRYCMVNCPYEIRVFNYGDYTKDIKAPLELLLNPDVTVRSKGVSEKCTFCVQRINEYERNSQLGNNPKMVQTACQQVCPSGAISFGNILSNKFKINREGYKLLESLNTSPAITYISKFRNAHKKKNIY